MHVTGHSKPVHWDNPEGWDGEGGRRGVQDRGTHVHSWLIHVNVWQKLPEYCNWPPIKSLKKSLIISEMQMKTTLNNITTIRMDIIECKKL